jgi:dUTP pyrophosphatase
MAAGGSDGTVDILVTRIDPDVPLPSYAHPGDAGADLVSTVDVSIEPGERTLVPTGIAIALPAGYVGLVHPRSGLAAKLGVSIVNAPGTIDAGYRGEVSVLLVNLDRSRSVHLSRGDRIAQLVVQQVERARFVEVERLPGSARGAGGYGSTGGFAHSPADPPVDPPVDSVGSSTGTTPNRTEEAH